MAALLLGARLGAWWMAALLCGTLPLLAADTFDETDEFEPDSHIVLYPGLLYGGGEMRGTPGGTRFMGGRGDSLRLAWVLTGDRSPGDADIVLDIAYGRGGGFHFEQLGIGARWIPLVRPRLTPFLGAGMNYSWVQTRHSNLQDCCGPRNDSTWGLYAGAGIEFKWFSIETRWNYLNRLYRQPLGLWSLNVGFGF